MFCEVVTFVALDPIDTSWAPGTRTETGVTIGPRAARPLGKPPTLVLFGMYGAPELAACGPDAAVVVETFVPATAGPVV